MAQGIEASPAGMVARARLARGNARVVVIAILGVLAMLFLAHWAGRPGAPSMDRKHDATGTGSYRYLDADSGLFQPVAMPAATGAGASAASDRQLVRVSKRAARQAVTTGVLEVTLPGVPSYPVHFEREETAFNGDWTMIGRVDTPLGKLAAVLTYGRDGVFGVLPTPDGRMLHVTTTQGRTYVQEAGDIRPPGVTGVAEPDYVVPPVPASATPRAAPRASRTTRDSLTPGQRQSSPAADGPRAGAASVGGVVASVGSEVQIKLLGVYTTNLVALRGSTSAVETEFTNLVAVANQAHIDSGTVARVQLVGFRETDYPATASNHSALYDLQANALPDGLDVYQARDSREADLVAMLRPYATGDNSCGVGYLGGFDKHPEWANPDYGYSVNNIDPCGPLVLAHELGHNMGSAHDVVTAGGDYGAFAFSYGYRQDGPPAFATVMAYNVGQQARIGIFSHPGSSKCLGVACGIEGEADNVRSINLQAERIARFRDPPNTISVFDAYAVEGDAGSEVLAFIYVRLSTPAPAGGVTFDLLGGGGTATNGSDYEFFDVVDYVIPEGASDTSFTVRVLGDSTIEPDETFSLTLGGVVGATVLDGEAVGTIFNDDPKLTISGRARFPAGSTPPSTPFNLWVHLDSAITTVSLSPPEFGYSVSVTKGTYVALEGFPPAPFAVEYIDLGVLNADTVQDIEVTQLVQVSGRVTTPTGGPSLTSGFYVNANVIEDGSVVAVESAYADAPDFTFEIYVPPGRHVKLVVWPPVPYLSQEIDLGIVSADTTRDIVLQKVPDLTVTDAAVTEGPAGTTQLVSFDVTLSAPAPPGGVWFDLESLDGMSSATAGSDYTPFSAYGQFIPEGFTSNTYQLQVLGDDLLESDESVVIFAFNVSGATLAGDSVILILDDDGPGDTGKAAATDFNADGESDLPWRNPASGQNMIWKSARSTAQQPVAGVGSPAWKVVGVGDFDGDEAADLLWRNSNTGANVIWKAGDASDQESITGVTNLDWRVTGVGDFDGDGESDILWSNDSTRANTIWKSADINAQQAVTAVTNPDWGVVGVGDFDGDGEDDLLWRNGKTGANVIWRSANYRQQQRMTGVTNVQWDVVGLGDFNGDGVDDVLWRNLATGANVVWRSADSRRQQAVRGVTNLAWVVAAVGDYDGDGVSDLLWRNGATGANVIWRSADAASQLSVAHLGTDWIVIP